MTYPLEAFIAKTDRRDFRAWRSIKQHSLDVAFAMKALLASPAIRSRLAIAFGEEINAQVIDTFCLFAMIHDAGKSDARWQAYVRGGARRDHTAPFLAHLGSTPELVDALGPVLDLVSDPEAMLLTVIAHHGAPIPEETQNQYTIETTDGPAVQEVSRLVGLGLKTFPRAARINWPAPFSHAYAGLLMLADWLGSSIAFQDGDRLRLIQELLRNTGWRAFKTGVDPASILQALRPGQEAVLNASLDERLLLLEDGTGSGKTEAAAIRALALIDASIDGWLDHPIEGLYFALPTRSAATEIYGRIAEIFSRMHPAQAGRVAPVIPTALDPEPLMPGQRRSWATGSTKKRMLAPVGVGTIDQAMLTVLTARHSWMRRIALSSKLLVVDEIHAGDSYMLSVIETLVHEHLDNGGHVLGLSATLGEEAKARLQRRAKPISIEASVAKAYPLLTAGVNEIAFPSASSKTISVSSRRIEAAYSDAQSAVMSGARVLWIRSTVGEALNDRDKFRNLGLQPALHHSRYAPQDRTLKDQEVLGLLGKSAPRDGGRIIVATQTCEQSLDIDADLLVTDVAPADVLLQRFGRMHRHCRSRPDGYHEPKVILIDPERWEAYLPEPGQHDGRFVMPPQGWRWIYPALPVVAGVEALLERQIVHLPKDQRALVEASTHRSSLQRLSQRGTAWRSAYTSFIDQLTTGRRVAGTALIDRQRQYGDCISEAVATRLGDGTYMVKTPGLVSPLDGRPIEEIGVPGRWMDGEDPVDVAGVSQIGDEIWSIDVKSQLLTYSADGLHRPKKR